MSVERDINDWSNLISEVSVKKLARYDCCPLNEVSPKKKCINCHSLKYL